MPAPPDGLQDSSNLLRDTSALFDGMHPINGLAALINMRSATHTTSHTLRRGRGFGWLELPASLVEPPRFRLHRL
jgi:hypothetical protein